jgi:hypothetical protein
MCVLRYFLAAIVGTLAALAPTLSPGFKVDAHIWIAQRVVADARDGSIGVDLADRRQVLELNPRYARVIRNHPKDFLLGSLGPDAFPDVIAGQMVIHPSVEGGWGTSDFLRHLLLDPSLTDKELAFTLGYLTHAASDVFAHTFVNRYAGDLFEIEDHEWAAVRHINIESYISKFLPPINAAGTPPAKLLRPGEELTIPSDLMLRKFLLNEEVIGQMRKSGNAPHLVGAYDIYTSLGDFLAEDGLLVDLEAIGAQYGIEAATGIPIAFEQARELQRISNRVTGELNNFAGDLSKFAQDLNTELGEIEGMRNELVAKGMTEALDVADQLTTVAIDISRKGLEVAQLVNELEALPKKVASEACKTIKGLFGKVLGKICETVLKTNPAWAVKDEALSVARAALNELQAHQRRLTAVGKQAIKDGLAIIQAELALRIELTNQLTGLLGNHPFSSQFRRPFEIWRHNIPVALVAYTKANAEVIVNTIDPEVLDTGNPDAPGMFDPLTDWLKCFLPAIVSPIPVELTGSVCEVVNAIEDVEAKINKLADTLARLTPLTEELADLHQQLRRGVEELKNELFGIAASEGLKKFDQMADTNVLAFYKALKEPASAGAVNDVMSRDRSNQNLLTINDAAQRIEAELSITNGVLDAQEFSPVYDAVVLSKLAMLDNAGLVQLSRRAGVTESAFGPDLYRDGGDVTKNILFGFVQNIDGNHQWHDISPPHPRATQLGIDRVDFYERYKNPDKGYGYFDKGACPRVLGMRMWVDTGARTALFESLFKGRIAFGVDKPEKVGPFAKVLPDNYVDLIGESDWSADGKTYPDQPPAEGSVTYKMTAPIDRDGTVTIKVDGAVVAERPVTVGQSIEESIAIARGVPAELEVIIRDVAGTVTRTFATSIGCDGEPGTIAGQTSMEVVKGDSLWRIAERLVDDGRRWPELFAANQELIDNPHLIYPGQVLTLPWSAPVTLERQG